MKDDFIIYECLDCLTQFAVRKEDIEESDKVKCPLCQSTVIEEQ
jgi:predicted Zn finger-like uncharacterized protein